jgi:phage terminase large subunit
MTNQSKLNLDSFFSLGVNQIVPLTLNSDKFVVIHQGGTSSGKTYGLMQCAIIKAITEPRSRILIIGKDVPSLKQGAMNDMQTILINDPQIEAYIKQFHSTDKTYFFFNGSRISFRSFETIDQAKHGKREYSFFNEANGIPYDIYHEISFRTTKQVWIDFNPNAEFWAHTKVWKPILLDANDAPILDENGEPKHGIDPTTILYKTTWRNNRKFLGEKQIAQIEKMKHTDPEKYKIYGLGEIGTIDGLVFNNVKVVKQWPDIFYENPHKYHVNQGLDFGFSKDPAAMVRTGVIQEEGKKYLYIDELFYGKSIMLDDRTENGIFKKGLKNLVRDNTQKGTYVFADNARPETIAELVAHGCSVRKATKKPGSVVSGLEMMLSYDEIRVTEKSVNLRKEFNNYSYGKDRDGENNVMPQDNFNHGIDAARYAELMRKFIRAQGFITIDPWGRDTGGITMEYFV